LQAIHVTPAALHFPISQRTVKKQIRLLLFVPGRTTLPSLLMEVAFCAPTNQLNNDEVHGTLTSRQATDMALLTSWNHRIVQSHRRVKTNGRGNTKQLVSIEAFWAMSFFSAMPATTARLSPFTIRGVSLAVDSRGREWLFHQSLIRMSP